MKNIIIILIIFLSNSTLFASVKEAETLYTNGDYDKALELYKKVIANGEESSVLYYNIGNCYYKLGQNTKAIIFYERALLLNPNDEALNYNLSLANRNIVDKLDVIPEIFFVRWYKSFVSLFSADQWAYICSALFIALLVLLLIFFYSNIVWLKKLSFYKAILCFLFVICTFVFAYQQNAKIKNREFAIISAPSVTVKGSPDVSGTDLFLIHEGLKVKIVDELGTWYNIVLLNGNEGWVSQKSLERI